MNPSRQPFSHPTSFPSMSPVINGSACPLNTFFVSKENSCKTCIKFSHTARIGSLSCQCNDGFSASGFGLTLRCSICEAGKFAFNSPTNCSLCQAGKYNQFTGASNCTSCPIGTYSLQGMTAPLSCKAGTFTADTNQANCTFCPPGTYSQSEGSTVCTPCPIGFFNPLSQQSSCTACQAGAITGYVGSIDSGQCVVLIPNFLIGTLTLGMVIIVFIYYVVFGYFHKESFKRKEKVVIPVAAACIQIGHKMLKGKENARNKTHRKLKLLLFFIGSFIGYIFVIMLTSFQALGKVFFNGI
jgi:hypothetical protein